MSSLASLLAWLGAHPEVVSLLVTVFLIVVGSIMPRGGPPETPLMQTLWALREAVLFLSRHGWGGKFKPLGDVEWGPPASPATPAASPKEPPSP